jgi:hypothetical protein
MRGHSPLYERATALIIAGVASLLASGCGGGIKHAPSQRDVNTIAAAMADIIYQCQSVAAGYIASADGASLKRDVNALLDAHSRLQANAIFVIGAPPAVTTRTTLRKELALAERNLKEAGCSPAQARRIADALGNH